VSDERITLDRLEARLTRIGKLDAVTRGRTAAAIESKP